MMQEGGRERCSAPDVRPANNGEERMERLEKEDDKNNGRR